MSKETGGQAFPVPATEWHGSDSGMDLRDYFAAKALQSIPLALDDGEQQLIANTAYRMADAMIAARSR